MSKIQYRRSAVAAMYTGLALTTVAVLVLYVAPNVLAGHIRAGYPHYTAAQVDSGVSIYLTYLTVVGALGALGWLASIWAASRGQRWVRWMAPVLFVLGTGIALFNLLIHDTSGDTGLPPLLGWLGILPCVVGLVAVVQVWRRRRTPA